MNVVLVIILVGVFVTVVLLLLLMRRRTPLPPPELLPRFDQIERGLERAERVLREDFGTTSRSLREEVGNSLLRLNDQLAQTTTRLFDTQATEGGRLQDALAVNLRGVTEQLQSVVISERDQASALRETVQLGLRTLHEAQTNEAARFQEAVAANLRLVAEQLQSVVVSERDRATALRDTVALGLRELHESNDKKLDQMRVVVEEKLQGTLDARLGESFRQVSDRLELVHRGLGEMQALAVGVGDLKKLMGNVKVRGSWGEMQLDALLGQVLAPEQYEKNVVTVPGSNDRVEFAIRVPGGQHNGRPVLMPVDSKFPVSAWQRLVEASEKSDADAVALAEKELESEIRRCAATIKAKYLSPPFTTDVAVLFVPVEALFAEVVRRAGLVDELMNKHRVVIAGPTTLAALLNSFQVGFRAVAIQERSAEVMILLGAVKTDLGKFGESIDRLQKQLHVATNTVLDMDKRRTIIGKKLKGVELMPSASEPLLAVEETDDLDEAA
jgi:DNA recombination protein RmuC